MKTSSVQRPIADGNSSPTTFLNETNLRNETGSVNESNETCKIIAANDKVSSKEEGGISDLSNITAAADINRQNGLASIADNYSGSDGETCTENSAVIDESSKEIIENDNCVGTHSISMSKKDTSLEKQTGNFNSGNTSLQTLKNESEGCIVPERNERIPTEHSDVGHTVIEPPNVGHTVIEPVNVGHTVVEPVNIGHTVIEPVNVGHTVIEAVSVGQTVTEPQNAKNIPAVSNTAHQVYAMNNIDNELEIISKEEGATQRGKTEENDSSLCENSSDSDDESSSSESSTSSSSSSSSE